MFLDEREENFREMAALGNVKAIMAYLRGGVDINGQNKVNGWTALHWACARSNARVVDILIRAGANVDIENNKGQTPIQVCKEDSVRALFPGQKNDVCENNNNGDGGLPAAGKQEGSDSSAEPSFVPNYLANPDLSKAWGIPEDAIMPIQSESGYMQQLQYEASMTKSNANPKRGGERGDVSASTIPTAATSTKTQERELLVYNGRFDDRNLLGSVFVDPHAQTISGLKKQIAEEIDGLPGNEEALVLARYNGKQTVPVGAKQETFRVDKIFRNADEAVIVLHKNSS
ncbi:hypothetical protein GGI25_005100 [Coemansia spiralis]|uniref:Ankyrin n=2 Tax=Coemansia TaxID=4863 RepID=A0A9W8G2W5_9FUNG|nr:hypothetical protein BX070DRAFT_231466 [Coemansia spiralis]KAJ1988912.1 hypothetical protein EDC05_005007 [Coemansia umbellata]KAJ2620013.1 hypothetical protein GGI26_005362 [Coemansia sp. RSA 1358]KAJ2672497.1 hypothetical protein GGI25_005100 [Coemansia spiralis]